MNDPRYTLEEILEQVRRLPEDERRRLVAELQADERSTPSDESRRATMKH
jgi:hypothetical protein